jgi:hypothetical protein
MHYGSIYSIVPPEKPQETVSPRPFGACFGAHSRATTATNALDHNANIATTRLYDRRKRRPEDSPTALASG